MTPDEWLTMDDPARPTDASLVISLIAGPLDGTLVTFPHLVRQRIVTYTDDRGTCLGYAFKTGCSRRVAVYAMPRASLRDDPRLTFAGWRTTG